MALVALCGCAGPGDGVAMNGSFEISIGATTVQPKLGVAIADPDDAAGMVIFVGERDIDCGLDILYDAPPRGSSFYTFVERWVGAQPDSYSAVWRVDAAVNKNVAFNAAITIVSMGDRIVGDATADAADDELGAIEIRGTFDVVRCF